jgi:hypothetical protein
MWTSERSIDTDAESKAARHGPASQSGLSGTGIWSGLISLAPAAADVVREEGRAPADADGAGTASPRPM